VQGPQGAPAPWRKFAPASSSMTTDHAGAPATPEVDAHNARKAQAAPAQAATNEATPVFVA
jgi:hypothetical protein